MAQMPVMKMPEELKKKIDALKVHPRQPAFEVVEKAVDMYCALKAAWNNLPIEGREDFRKKLGSHADLIRTIDKMLA